jgi:hypothetical protein
MAITNLKYVSKYRQWVVKYLTVYKQNMWSDG